MGNWHPKVCVVGVCVRGASLRSGPRALRPFCHDMSRKSIREAVRVRYAPSPTGMMHLVRDHAGVAVRLPPDC